MPTKALFIGMLTRDIALIPAIIDLVDNAADGARNLRKNGDYRELEVRLEVSPKRFRITDNCGGMSINTARHYAFRFGRDDRAPTVSHSIGQFGVGMKRAVFKLGNSFRVTSRTDSEHFVVAVDVPIWAQEKDTWEFKFAEVGTNESNAMLNRGTQVAVTALHPDVAEKFGSDSFRSELSLEIQSRLQDALSKGLVISVNGVPISANPLLLLTDKTIAPAGKTLRYPVSGGKTVTVKLVCGLGASDRSAAGWHVFCNGRLVLEADKSVATGWGEKSRGIDIPGFHGQYNHLRGFAYFDCDDPGRLPWNTTKTGVDTDSAVYKAARLQMIGLMRPVVTFLNQLKLEKEGSSSELGPLEALVTRSKQTPVSDITVRRVFRFAVASSAKRAATQRIQYDMSAGKAEQVKKLLRASSWKEVGTRTFDYFYSNEVGE